MRSSHSSRTQTYEDIYVVEDDEDDHEEVVGQQKRPRPDSPDDPLLLKSADSGSSLNPSHTHWDWEQEETSLPPMISDSSPPRPTKQPVQGPIDNYKYPPPFPSPSPPPDSLHDFQPAEDGPSTGFLRNSIRVSRAPSSDPIESFSDDPSVEPKPGTGPPRHSTPGYNSIPPNIVSQRASNFGQRRIDLTNPPLPSSRRGIVSSMQVSIT
jgi:hypothetical protein